MNPFLKFAVYHTLFFLINTQCNLIKYQFNEIFALWCFETDVKGHISITAPDMPANITLALMAGDAYC